MTYPKHTTGPWTTEVQSGERVVVGTRNGKPCVIAAQLYDYDNEPTLEEVDANGHLMAMAKEFVEVLEEICAGHQQQVFVGSAGYTAVALKSIHKARALLGKLYGVTA